MFKGLSQKLDAAFQNIRGKGKLSEQDIQQTMKSVRMALLEADVQFRVAKQFCERVGELSLGEEVLRSLTPDQQIIKIVHNELTRVMGEHASEIILDAAPPIIIMLVGLQGSGKTTTIGKLGRFLRDEKKRRPLLVPADVYRPAAIEQLKTVGAQLSLEVYPSSAQDDPVDIAKAALNVARKQGFDVVLIDTAGRLQIDQELMTELQEVSAAVEPHEILLVADAMTGQEAVNVAEGFHKALDIDGLILTKLDGDARGGAALSMKAVTGRPIKFIGVGEKLDALEVFHPERMSSRILGMGDVLSFIEKASREVDLEDAAQLQKKMKKQELDLEDFLKQLKMVKKMGSVSSLLAMIPGLSKMANSVDSEQAEGEMKRIEAIILSMTPKERKHPSIINGSRRKRISLGSGTKVEEVNRLLKQFLEMKKMMKKLTKSGMGGLLGGKGLGGMFPGMGKMP